MKENHILQFTIFTDPSSTQSIGWNELVMLIKVDAYYHRNIVWRIYNEMQEYILHPLHDLLIYPINNSINYEKNVVLASFCCANISTLDLILRRLESYEGVKKSQINNKISCVIRHSKNF